VNSKWVRCMYLRKIYSVFFYSDRLLQETLSLDKCKAAPIIVTPYLSSKYNSARISLSPIGISGVKSCDEKKNCSRYGQLRPLGNSGLQGSLWLSGINFFEGL
jgi:hypothetical protein